LDKVLRKSKNPDFHPLQDLENKMWMNLAKLEAKSYNRHAAKVDKIEQKILEKANRMHRAEMRKQYGMGEIVSAFARGQEIKRPKIEPITDLEKAKEMLGSNHLLDSYKKAAALRDNKKQNLNQALGIVAQNLSERRQSIEQSLQQVIDRANRGEFGYGDRAEAKLEEIGKNFHNASGGTAFNKNDLDPTLLAYLEKNGYTAFFDQEASFSQDLLNFGQQKVPEQDKVDINSLLYAMNDTLKSLEMGNELTEADLIILSDAYDHGLDIGEIGIEALLEANERGDIQLDKDMVLDLTEELEGFDHEDHSR
jgi:hypothetical protein